MTAVSIVEMRKRIVEILDFLIEEDQMDLIDLQHDYYWDVAFTEEPYDLDIVPIPALGSMEFDWEMILKSRPDSKVHLVYFSQLLRYVALRA